MRDVTVSDWNKFGAIIKAERADQALSQHELAARAGVSRSWLAKLEAGHRGAEFEQILRLLEALGLSLVLRSGASARPEDEAIRDLMDKQQRSAENRRRAWSADGLKPAASDHG
ncbi:helix-turn-helix domain-containing protein [Kribbella sp. NPDC056345]|uniref:helix-turn-helix domain-containing protein n=1 Tax=Kribbella sp. NPDC056345 TaxID=3345789 RepID=UPI0035E2C678